MSNDPIGYWTRQLGLLRAQAGKLGRVAPGADFADNALAACDGLVRDLAGLHLECDRLRAKLRTSNDSWEHLFDAIPGPCLLTDGKGLVLSANQAAGVLLNVSTKRLSDRELMVFCDNREKFAALVHRLAGNGRDEHRATLTFRPRERKPAALDIVVLPLAGHDDLWLWFLTPALKVPTAPLPPLESTTDSLNA